MEYRSLSEIAEAIYHHADIDYNAVRDFLISHDIHPDTLVAYPGRTLANFPSTLMNLAICCENAEMAKTLLELGSDPYYGYDEGTLVPSQELLYPESVDWDYVHTPKLEIMKLFLEHGFDIDKPMDKYDNESFYDYLQYSVYENGNDYHRIILSIVEPYHKE